MPQSELDIPGRPLSGDPSLFAVSSQPVSRVDREASPFLPLFRPHHKVRDRSLDVIHGVFLASIAFAPFYFGGDRLLAWGLTGGVQSVVCLALALFTAPKSMTDPFEDRLLLIAQSLFVVIFLWAIIQILPLSSPDLVHPIWKMTEEALDEPVHGMISVSPDEGYLTLVKLSVVAITFLNAKQIYRLSQSPYRLVASIALIASAYTLLGMIWLRFDPTGHIWLETSPYKPNLVSTFVNRNSFAQYLGMGSLCAIATLIHLWRRHAHTIRSSSYIHFFIRDHIRQSVFYLLIFAILLIGILLTASRGGFLSALAGYSVFLFAVMKLSRGRFIAGLLILAIMFGVGYAVYGAYSDPIGERNMSIGEDYRQRFELYREVWSLILERPWLGYGLGSFEVAFRAHQSIQFDPFGIWHRAHNVYLDVIVALGLPAAGLVMLAVFIPFFLHIRRLYRLPLSIMSLLLCALYVQLLIHSLFDFGLQTGGNIITAAALLGASLTAPKRLRIPKQ